MLDFIVLGTIPGTSLQIGFSLWLAVVLILAGIFILRSFYHHRTSLLRLAAPLVIALMLSRSRRLA